MDSLSHMLELENAPVTAEHVVFGGMGGSAAAAHGAAALLAPGRTVCVHESYELPAVVPAGTLHIAVSYSGNTEETLSFFEAALARGEQVAAVTSGGELLSRARELGVPIAVVAEDITPRDAFPYLLRATLALLGENELISEIANVQPDDETLSKVAADIAAFLEGKTPLIYMTERAALVGRIMKMYWNETAKIPAFISVLPARSHDELQGFDKNGPHFELAKQFGVLMLKTEGTHPRTIAQQDAYAELLKEAGIDVREVALPGSGAELLFSGWRLGGLAARAFAEKHGLDPDDTPLTREMKVRIKK